MRDIQFADGFGISVRIVLKNDNAVPDVVFDGINVPVLWVDIDATVELNIRLRAPNDAFRFCARRIRRRVVETIEDPDAPCVGILEVDFVQSRINRHSAVNGISVEYVADGRTSYIRRCDRLLSRRIYWFVFECGEQVVVD